MSIVKNDSPQAGQGFADAVRRTGRHDLTSRQLSVNSRPHNVRAFRSRGNRLCPPANRSPLPSAPRWCSAACRSRSGSAHRRPRFPGRDLGLDQARHRRARPHRRQVLVDDRLRHWHAGRRGRRGRAAPHRGTVDRGRRAARLPRLNLHGTGLDGRGLPVKPVRGVTGAMWLKARADARPDRRPGGAARRDLRAGEPQRGGRPSRRAVRPRRGHAGAGRRRWTGPDCG